MDDIDEVLYTVGEVAALFRITVRTLHHWEAQGLLSPTWRSWSNYRLYTEDDCARVQKILIYRATGMKLTDIKQLLDGGASDLEHLRRQRESLLAQRDSLTDMLAAIDTLMEDAMNNRKLTTEEIGQIVGDANFAAHQQEAEEAYGSTEDWAMYQQRTAGWSKENWSDAQAGVAEVGKGAGPGRSERCGCEVGGGAGARRQAPRSPQRPLSRHASETLLNLARLCG